MSKQFDVEKAKAGGGLVFRAETKGDALLVFVCNEVTPDPDDGSLVAKLVRHQPLVIYRPDGSVLLTLDTRTAPPTTQINPTIDEAWGIEGFGHLASCATLTAAQVAASGAMKQEQAPHVCPYHAAKMAEYNASCVDEDERVTDVRDPKFAAWLEVNEAMEKAKRTTLQ